MYVTEIFGGMGTLYAPSTNTRGRYQYGIVTESNGLARPYLIVTNGKLDHQALEQARYTGLLAKAVVPIVPVPAQEPKGSKGGNYSEAENIDTFRMRVKAFIKEKSTAVDTSKPATNIHDFLNIRYHEDVTGTEAPKTKIQMRKLLTKTWPKLDTKGFSSWTDDSYRYLACEASWFDGMVNNLQYYITTQLQTLIHGGFTIAPYGLGTVDADLTGLKIDKHPSTYTKFFSNNKAKMFLVSDNRTNNDRGYTWYHLVMLAEQIAKMLKPVFKNADDYGELDYLAMASEIVANKAGYGESSMMTNYQGTDIVGQVRDEIGNGIATAFPWQNFSAIAFEEILEFWIIKAVVCARIKAMLTPVTIELYSGDRIRSAFDFQMESKPELPSVGSEGQPYMFTPTNKPGSQLWIPMAMIDNPDKQNIYERQLQRQLSTSKIAVKNSEIQGNPLEPKNTKEQFLQWVVENDARRWEIEFPYYKLYVWRFPLNGWDTIVDDKDEAVPMVNPRYQWMLFILSQMAQGQTTYADGYFIHNHIGLYGSIATPYTYGAANPIQMALDDKPIKDRAAADKIEVTARPERISNTETSQETQSGPPVTHPPTEPEATKEQAPTPPAAAANTVKGKAASDA